MYQFLSPVIFIPVFLFGLLFVVFSIKAKTYYKNNPNGKRIDMYIYKRTISYSNSIIIWNTLFWIAYIGTALSYPAIAAIFSTIGSVLVFAIILDGRELDSYDKHTWPYATFLFLLILFMFSISKVGVLIGKFIYKNTIQRFNNWVDNL